MAQNVVDFLIPSLDTSDNRLAALVADKPYGSYVFTKNANDELIAILVEQTNPWDEWDLIPALRNWEPETKQHAA